MCGWISVSLMRVVYAGAGKRSYGMLCWLSERSDIVGVIHQRPKEEFLQEKYNAERPLISYICETVIDTNPNKPNNVETLARLQPDLLLNFVCGYVYRKEVLNIPRIAAVNVHPSLLPLHRGNCPAAWSIIEGTAAGVTVYVMDEGIDTGPVIMQTRVEYDEQTSHSELQRRLCQAKVDVLKEAWASLGNGFSANPQRGVGCYHILRDYAVKVAELKESVSKVDKILLQRLES